MDKTSWELVAWVVGPWVFVGCSYALNLGIAALVDWMI